MSDLKPCPFCGGPAAMTFSEFELHNGHHVVCHGNKNCPLYCSQPYRAHDTEQEAAAIWNARPFLEPPASDVAGWRLVPVEPTPEMLEPFARVLCRSLEIDPDEPERPHGEWPVWYGQCGPLAAAFAAMIAAAPPHPASKEPG
jgi:hypothetical protein